MRGRKSARETNELKWKRMRLILDKLKEGPMQSGEIEQLICRSRTDNIVRRSVQNYLAELVALGVVNYTSQAKVYEWFENKKIFRSKHDYDIALKHSRNLILPTRERLGFDQTNPCLALDLLVYEPERDIDYQCLCQHLRTGYSRDIYKLMEKYRRLMDETGLSETRGLPKLFSASSSWVQESHMAGLEENIARKKFEGLMLTSFPTKGDELIIDVNSIVLGSKSPNIKYVHKAKYIEIVSLRDLLIGKVYSVVNDVIQGIPLQGFCDHCPDRKITIKGK